MKSKIVPNHEITEAYKIQVIDLAYEIAKKCKDIFDDKDPNLIINAVNRMHADLIIIITKKDPQRAIQAVEMEAKSLILNVKYMVDRNDN